MALSNLPLPPNFGGLGFSDPTTEFVRITTTADDAGRAMVDGVVVIPGLPVCRVRMKTDADRITATGRAAARSSATSAPRSTRT